LHSYPRGQVIANGASHDLDHRFVVDHRARYGSGVMVSSAASTVRDYLASLPSDRRAAIARVRDVVNARLPDGYQETMQHGMISWVVPPSRLAKTYNGQALMIAGLASQKDYMALYLMSVYGESRLGTWFRAAYKAAGKKLDMGKSCVRFKTLDALPLAVIGEAVSRVSVDDWVAIYEGSRGDAGRERPVAAARPARRKPAAKRAVKSAKAKPAAPSRRKPAAKRRTRR
jgi:hypothetical protein